MLKNHSIDINADVGEGAGNDPFIMPYISSCNIACGGHYGDERSMRSTIKLAIKNNVKIGAHPAYPDRENFGRQQLDILPKQLFDALTEQLSLFQKVCKDEGVKMHHIKPHGALYNQGANDPEVVQKMIQVFQTVQPQPTIYLQDQSLLHKNGQGFFSVKREAFIDRTYQKDRSLVRRSDSDAVIRDPEKAWQQLHELIKNEQIILSDGQKVSIHAETFCIHGDNDNSVAILQYIHRQLALKGLKLI